MCIEAAIIFASTATVFDACIPVIFYTFNSSKYEKDEDSKN